MGDDGTRLDRELLELLNEVRVMLPGLSVLFAFLLTVPFTNRFTDLDRVQRGVFFTLFLFTFASMVLLKAPSAYHRLRFREHDKEVLMRYANRCTIVGIAFTGVAFSLAIYLATSMVFGSMPAWIAGAASALLTLALWFAVPLVRKAT